MASIVLASSSPRRRELLRLLGIDPDVQPADIDETPRPDERAGHYVERLAREKTRVAVTDLPVVAADTSVVVDGDILGKPTDHDHALSMLRRLSGRSHEVITGVAVRIDDRVESATDTTTVQFATLSDGDIQRYLATDEPWDKAGAYGLQGAGGVFVERIDGTPSNVIGLPLPLLRNLFNRHHLELLDHG